MKRNLILLAVVLMAALTNVHAQATQNLKKTEITGTIIEAESKQPLQYATVQLFSLPDSTFRGGAISRADGSFTLSATQGQSFVRITSMGLATQTRNIIIDEKTQPKVDLGQITMSELRNSIAEIEIVAPVVPVVQKGDTTTYNAAAFTVAEGSALEDLLKKLPGAEVDENGNLTINGQSIKKVMMDGEEYEISDLNTAMKDIPADMIEQLQVYRRKSDKAIATGIDDGNSEMVLNLRVKKDRKQGWNGNLMAGIGNDSQYQGKANVNRFKDRMNFSANVSTDDNGISRNKRIGINYSKRTDRLNIGADLNFDRNDNNRWSLSDEETFLTDTTSQYSHSESSNKNNRNNIAVGIRMEWRPDTLTTISFRPRINYSSSNQNGTSSSWTQNNSREYINRKESGRPTDSHSFGTSGSLYINRRLGKPGRNLSLNIDFRLNNSSEDSRNRSKTYYMLYGDSVQIRDQHILTDNNSDELSARLNYTEPLFKNHFLELSYSYRTRPSTYERYAYNWNDSIQDFETEADSAQSRCTRNVYDIQQASIAFIANTQKLNYTLGVELESQRYYTRNYFQNITVTEQARTVTNYAPRFNLSYKFNDNTSLRMDYRGRSSQPSVNDLQPITDNTDPLNIRTGNPDLKPGFNNNMSVNFNRSSTKRRSNISVSADFSNQMNRVAWITTFDESTGVRTSAPRNVNGNWAAGLRLNAYTPIGPKEKSRFSVSANSQYRFDRRVSFTRISGNKNSVKNITKGNTLSQQVKGTFRAKNFDTNLSGGIRYYTTNSSVRPESNRSTYDYTLHADVNATLFWGIQLSTDIDCRMRRGYGSRNDRTQTMWNAQVSKAFLKRKNIILRFNLYDLLHERAVEIGHSVSENSVRDWSSSSAVRYMLLSVTYKFNKFGAKRSKKKAK